MKVVLFKSGGRTDEIRRCKFIISDVIFNLMILTKIGNRNEIRSAKMLDLFDKIETILKKNIDFQLMGFGPLRAIM